MQQKTRHLKIFISSTFQDMQEERKVLLKEVFLELKKIARERDVEITEIDLRWGITQKAADSGKTVKICLDEIERCKDSPIFFLGMIGNRYGWNKWYDDIDKNIFNDERYAWIEEYKDKSITELEIMSVLKRGDDHNKVLLYLKDDERENEAAVEELKKELIELSSIKENIDVDKYENIKEFRRKVKGDLFRIFDELYPMNENLTEKEKLYAPHNSFARERQKVYVTDKDAFHEMTMFLESEYNIAVFYGKESIGKSAFIVNYFNDYVGAKVISYYIGCSNSDEDIRSVLSSITMLVDLPQRKTDRSQSIDNIISDFLTDISNFSEALLIVIDGIDELEEEERNIFLHHLLEEFEDKKTLSKIVITVREEQRKFKFNYPLYPMETEEKQSLVEQYLYQYGKKLTNDDMDYITSHDNIDNIDFFMILLNEIRLLGNFERFREDIKSYLNAKDTVELFEKILLRFEYDYGEQLTQSTLSLLCLVRDGLSEDELFKILNYMQEDGVVTRLEFSPLFLALEPYLANTNGSYKLKNKYLREVVEYRYLFTQEMENEIRNYIAHFFWDKNTLVDDEKRAVRETIYQVHKAGDIFSVVEFLLIPMTFFYLIIFDRDMLWKYIMDINGLNNEQWNYLEEIHSKIMKEDYDPRILKYITEFFSFDLGAKDYALSILHKMEKLLIENTDTEGLAECYRDMADNYQYNARKWGDKDAKVLSIKYAKKASTYAYSSPLTLASQYYIEAKNFQYSGEFKEKGLEKYLKSLLSKEKVLGELDDEVIFDYRNLGNICRQEGLYAEADRFFTIAWERSRIFFGDLSKEVYLAGRNIAELYYSHAKPLRPLEDFLKSMQDKHGTLSKETLKDLEVHYHERSGWDSEDYNKLLEITKLMLKSVNTYEKDKLGMMMIYGYVAHTYHGVGDTENHKKYRQLSDSISENIK